MRYVRRTLEPVVRRALREFPVVTITGPRQSGKTTLLRHMLERSHRYVTLEPHDVRTAAADDPRGFLALHPPPVVIDEVQHAPNLLTYVKDDVDSHRAQKGRYVLSGSQNLLLSARISESLAGLTAVLKLLPFSMRELAGSPAAGLPWESGRHKMSSGPAHLDLWRRLLAGTYPELALAPRRDIGLWHAGYVQTYLERDVRAVRQVGDLSQFHAFLRVLAARSAQILDLSGLARDLGVAVNTVKAWLSVLEATHQVLVLRPYHSNLGKRMVKSPKAYLTDTGLLCHLTGIRTVEQAMSGPLAGAIFETAVVNEVIRVLVHRGQDPAVWFWRTAAGNETDLLVEHRGRLVPVEAKSTASPVRRMAGGIDALCKALGHQVDRGFVVHAGDVRLPLGPNAVAWPFGRM